MRVLRSPDGPLGETDAAERAITFDDLLTHRAGLTYADFHRGPIAQAYREVLGCEIASHLAPEQYRRSRRDDASSTDRYGDLLRRTCQSILLDLLLMCTVIHTPSAGDLL